MKLTNVVVQFTVTIPEIEVDKELGLDIARIKLRLAGRFAIENGEFNMSIKDCPDYPALCD